MKHYIQLMLLLLSACTLSGCWNASDIEHKGYVKALGIDYKDGQYIVHAQLLKFSTIAKSDSSGGGGDSGPSIDLGKGQGRTLNLATDDLYNTAQVTIAWGHLSSLIISEQALQAQGKSIIEMLNRYPDIRYNTWLYTTKEPIESILSTNSLFKLPPIFSILHDPKPNYNQNSIISPILLFKYIAQYNEPAITSFIPSLGVNKQQWKQPDKPLPLLMIKGAYFQSPTGKSVYLNRSKLFGYNWMQKEMKRAPLNVARDGTEYAHLNISDPKIKIKSIMKGNDVAFQIIASYNGAMFEYNEPMPYHEMTQLAEEIIKKQIVNVYKEGLKNGIDIYNLGDVLRHDNLKQWKKLSNNGKTLIVHNKSIDKLEVKINITYNGKYKRIAS
ncbi:Ger(x)C family spore germination protein [Paenibacillus sp. GSMTC-2017]|uniref:Ger(x)C family spore germination protein n=1 Tax=Paenibacillus sp. GSMTC-2017 TaxID=2794350 RepID=UPI0018D7C1E9|nr:Ger(x)C family spore germination protein [Paenibacillus sp. GSMTC-2017]MBH5319015.1 Ger(x)C family spore germination protein [Paenibacillus sp. GSMTC-2017]